MPSTLKDIFPRTLALDCVHAVLAEGDHRAVAFEADPASFPVFLAERFRESIDGIFPVDLAAIEYALYEVREDSRTISRPSGGEVINPVLRIVPVRSDAASRFKPDSRAVERRAGSFHDWVVVWRGPETGRTYVETADERMLLALKFLLEDERPKLKGRELRVVREAIDHASRKGIVLKAPYLVARELQGFPEGKNIPPRYLTASVFTLQWHITNACDLHCRHCYDREKRSPLTGKKGLAIVDDFERFCEEKNVRAHICFSGGNPFLSPHFFRLYEAVAAKGMATSILGNPVSRGELRRCTDIQPPDYFQVSLEGLEAHNDFIRGEGYFGRVLDFLDLLRENNVPSAVMLTLTRANMDQVLPLAELLRGKADQFTFNRLSQVGEGAALSLPRPEEYRRFLVEYMDAARLNPVIGLKDNLINILRLNRGVEPFGGCTGFGCGAAFNFLALLPDGEVHACRKFPSLIGTIHETGFLDLYESDAAARYRRGPESCSSCGLRPVCGGCMAVVHGMGLDPFRDKDPFCFLDEQDKG